MEESPFATLPAELLSACFVHLLSSVPDILSAGSVSKHWNEASYSQHVWRLIFKSSWTRGKLEGLLTDPPTLPPGDEFSWRNYCIDRFKIDKYVSTLLEKAQFLKFRIESLQRLIHYGDDAADALTRIMTQGDPFTNMSARYWAREALIRTRRAQIREQWRAARPLLLRSDPESFNIEIGAAAIDSWMNNSDPAVSIAQLDQLAEELRASPGFEALSQRERFERMNHFFTQVWRFEGNSDDYYNPSNSLLHCVLEQRKGIPISLSGVYAAICRRVGLRIELVGFPGHFLVAFQEAVGAAKIYVDVFNNCRVLPRDSLMQAMGPSVWNENYIQASSFFQVFYRMINNLVSCYEAQGTYDSAHDARGALIAISDACGEHQYLYNDVRRRLASPLAVPRYEDVFDDYELLLSTAATATERKTIEHRLRVSRGEFDEACKREEEESDASFFARNLDPPVNRVRIGQIVHAFHDDGIVVGYTELLPASHFLYHIKLASGALVEAEFNMVDAIRYADHTAFDAVALGQYFERWNGQQFLLNKPLKIRYPNEELPLDQ